MDELVEWYGQQLDTDERIAREATDGPWSVDNESYAESISAADGTPVVAGGRWGGEASVFESTADALHIATHDPARVLREIDAKRRTLERHTPHSSGTIDCSAHCSRPHPGAQVCNHDGHRWPCPDARDLAAAYADRPGYLESWRP